MRNVTLQQLFILVIVVLGLLDTALRAMKKRSARARREDHEGDVVIAAGDDIPFAGRQLVRIPATPEQAVPPGRRFTLARMEPPRRPIEPTRTRQLQVTPSNLPLKLAAVRRGIVMREILGPCRGLEPMKSGIHFDA